jgi:hypothetical protein
VTPKQQALCRGRCGSRGAGRAAGRRLRRSHHVPDLVIGRDPARHGRLERRPGELQASSTTRSPGPRPSGLPCCLMLLRGFLMSVVGAGRRR